MKLVDLDGMDTVFANNDARRMFNNVYNSISQKIKYCEESNKTNHEEYKSLTEVKLVLDDIITSGTKFYYNTLPNKDSDGRTILNGGSTYGKEEIEGVCVDFTNMSEETFIHESRHAAGYARGEWDFDRSLIDEFGKYGLINYDYMDEYGAYRMENDYSVWLMGKNYKPDWQIKDDVKNYSNNSYIIREFTQYTRTNPYRK